MTMGLFKRKPVDPEVQAAYDKAYREERIKLAEERGRAAGRNPPKPFYQKLAGVGKTVGKAVVREIGKPSPRSMKPKGDPFAFIIGGEEAFRNIHKVKHGKGYRKRKVKIRGKTHRVKHGGR